MANGRGRPRSFDRERALEQAMLSFWEHGYEGTGMDALASAMGIGVSSLYATFGAKEELFLAALDHYQRHRGQYTASSMEGEGTARQAFGRLFEIAAVELTRPDQPKGCMLALALPTCSPEIELLREQMNERRGRSLERFASRLSAAVKSGELPAGTDTAAFAQFFITMLQGMSIQARTGASKSQLREVGHLAMQIWPKGGSHAQEHAGIANIY